MFFLKRPTEAITREFLAAQSHQPFSYAEVGATRSVRMSGYTADLNRIRLGEGGEVFDRGIKAIREWEMFKLGWIRVSPRAAPIEEGAAVAVLAHHLGFYSLNACRIVYVVDEDGDVKRYGFAYGTLPDHAERGEERFTVEWNRADNSVWYEVLALSRPNKFLSWVGYPVTRYFQRRFSRDSKQAVWRACASPE